MSEPVEYRLNRATVAELAGHLRSCDADFLPPLSERVVIESYADKIARKATRFEAWSGGTLVGLVAVYGDDRERRSAFITNVSVLGPWTGQGVAARLLARSVEHARDSGMRRVVLEVSGSNAAAVRLYEKAGFVAGDAGAPTVRMTLTL